MLEEYADNLKNNKKKKTYFITLLILKIKL